MRKSILIIGDFAEDVAVTCEVNRLCPEAPIPVAVPVSSKRTYGMAGNVFDNVNNLNLGHYKIETFYGDRICIKTRYIDKATGYIMLRVDVDSRSTGFNPVTLKNSDLLNVAAIVLSDYNKGFLNEQNIQTISEIAVRHKIPTFLDTKLPLGKWSSLITCIKINEKEYDASLLATQTKPEKSCKALVLTRSGQGALLYSDGKLVKNIPTTKVNVTDVCGAGDTMLAALVLKYLSNDSLEEAVSFANKLASFAVTKHGVYAVTRQDMIALGLSL